MKERQEVIDFCLTLGNSYEDYPFSDHNWTLIRHKENNKCFAWIFRKDGNIWVNVKCRPEWCHFWRDAFEGVVPAYHLNKTHWNSIILNGTVPEEECKNMIRESYELTKNKR